jgi:hypothetical protein
MDKSSKPKLKKKIQTQTQNKKKKDEISKSHLGLENRCAA